MSIHITLDQHQPDLPHPAAQQLPLQQQLRLALQLVSQLAGNMMDATLTEQMGAS